MILLAWGRGEVWGYLVLFGGTAVAFAVVGLTEGRLDVVGASVPVLVVAGTGYLGIRAAQALRRPPPLLRFPPGGGLVLEHPALAAPLELAASDVHSAWLGPFEPPRRGSSWVTPIVPARPVDVSGARVRERTEDRLVVAFTRTLDLRPRHLVPSWLWFAMRSRPPVWDAGTNGLTVRVLDHDAAARALTASGLTRRQMPDDVRAWLAL